MVNKIVFAIIFFFALVSFSSWASDNQKSLDLNNNSKEKTPKVEEILSELAINEEKDVAELIEYLYLFENFELLQMDLEEIQVLDLLLFSSQ